MDIHENDESNFLEGLDFLLSKTENAAFQLHESYKEINEYLSANKEIAESLIDYLPSTGKLVVLEYSAAKIFSEMTEVRVNISNQIEETK